MKRFPLFLTGLAVLLLLAAALTGCATVKERVE